MKFFVQVLLFIFMAGLGACEQTEKTIIGQYHIKNVTIVDGTGNPPYISDVTINQGKISAIHDLSKYLVVEGEVIDGTGKFLIPGLWDMHVHLAADVEVPSAPDALLSAGVTTVRDTGGYPGKIFALRAAIEEGTRAGPNIFLVGPTLNGESFAGFQVAVSDPDQAREEVRELYRAGVDVIKIHRATSAAVLKAISNEAHGLGLKVAGHIPLGNPPTLVCSGDLDSVEHLGSFLEAYISVSQGEGATMAGALAFMLSNQAEELFQCLSASGVYVTPTVVIYPYIAKQKGGPEMEELGRKTVSAMQEILNRFRNHKIPLMAGTDAPLTETKIPFGISLVEELEILAGAGYSSLELLQIATRNPAEFMGVYEEVGSIEEGKRADLVLLTENPLEDISNLRSVEAVFVRGKKVK